MKYFSIFFFRTTKGGETDDTAYFLLWSPGMVQLHIQDLQALMAKKELQVFGMEKACEMLQEFAAYGAPFVR